MNAAAKRRLVLLPVGFTLALVVWTALVYRQSSYGTWHIYPALAVVPLVLVGHVGLIIWGRPRWGLFIYAVIHLLMLSLIWLACLMLISKDSL